MSSSHFIVLTITKTRGIFCIVICMLFFFFPHDPNSWNNTTISRSGRKRIISKYVIQLLFKMSTESQGCSIQSWEQCTLFFRWPVTHRCHITQLRMSNSTMPVTFPNQEFHVFYISILFYYKWNNYLSLVD